MKRILISGYYGFGNAGDEAVLAAMLASLRRSIPDVRCEVLSAAPAMTTRLHHVPAAHRARPREVVRALRQCDLFISGGGSLLQDVTSFSSLFFYLAQIRLARLLRRRVMLYAQGIGPLVRPAARRLTARVLRKVDWITVRDAASAAELRCLGLTAGAPPVEVTADPVFALEPVSTEWAQAELEACCRETGRRGEGETGRRGDAETGEVGDGPGVQASAARSLGYPIAPSPPPPISPSPCPPVPSLGISLRDWPGLEGCLDSMAEVIRKASAELGLMPVYFPLQATQDAPVCHRVAATTGGCVLPGNYAPGEWMALAGRMDLFLGMRLHALIFAAARGVPVVGIAYDPKVTSLLARLGQQPAAALPEFNPAAVGQALRNTGNVREQRSVQIREASAALAAAAEIGARRAAALLGLESIRQAEPAPRARGQTPAGR